MGIARRASCWMKTTAPAAGLAAPTPQCGQPVQRRSDKPRRIVPRGLAARTSLVKLYIESRAWSIRCWLRFRAWTGIAGARPNQYAMGCLFQSRAIQPTVRPSPEEGSGSP